MKFLFILMECRVGNTTIKISDRLIGILSNVIDIIQIVIPVLLVVWGMIDFVKSIISQKEDEIKKGQKMFVKRLIAAVIFFLIILVVEFLFGLLGQISGTDADSIWKCVERIFS